MSIFLLPILLVHYREQPTSLQAPGSTLHEPNLLQEKVVLSKQFPTHFLSLFLFSSAPLLYPLLRPLLQPTQPGRTCAPLMPRNKLS